MGLRFCLWKEEQMSDQGVVPVAKHVELYYRVAGAGRSVVLVPSAAWLEADLEPLAQGRTVVFYDQRGRGRSDADPSLTRVWTDYEVEDMEVIRETVDAERVAIVGWSYMGAVAALYASAYPDRVERLVLMCPIPPRSPAPYDDPQAAESRADDRVPASARERLMELRDTGVEATAPVEYCREYYRVHIPRQMANPQALDRMRSDPCRYPNEWPQNLAEHHRQHFPPDSLVWDWREQVGNVQSPALIIHGMEDLTPVEASREWASSLPNAGLLALPGVGHYPHLEAPTAFYGAVESFLGGEWPTDVEHYERAALAGRG
jgi:proline iminopeptidase